MTNKLKLGLTPILASGMLAFGGLAAAYESGSTGADGALSPQVDTTLQLPEDGVFNFTTVTIPSGVTLSFTQNATNTPVVILASGDITIEGSINLNGSQGSDTAAKGDGNLGDDGLPGQGGPGGFDGGAGGTVESPLGGNGLGPGGGAGAINVLTPFSRPTGCCSIRVTGPSASDRWFWRWRRQVWNSAWSGWRWWWWWCHFTC